MSEYGVTSSGFVKKRLDRIISEVQSDLTDGLGFDVSLNPQSILNVLITNYADRIAQLWEVAEQVYYSQYPSSAEGVNLDNAGQFAGITRKGDQRTKYLVLCTGDDGTAIPKGSIIASATTPKKRFVVLDDYSISRSSFNKATVKVVSVVDDDNYVVTINGNSYSCLNAPGDSAEDIVSNLAHSIGSKEKDFAVTADGNMLKLECNSETRSNTLELSENLTTHKVSSIVLWQSEEFGNFVLPKNSITQIVTTITGFDSCYNVSIPFYGRLRETDVEFRQSFLKKISSRSSCMLESITSAILENIDGVLSARGFENTSNEEDDDGRPPHSIEIVVDGGDEAEIASTILNTKAAGIGTFGDVSVDVPTSYGDTIKINFNRPENVYVYYRVALQKHPSQPLPPNYKELVQTAILECMNGMRAGDPVIPQDYIPRIKELCSGIVYVGMEIGTSKNEVYPEVFVSNYNFFPNPREKAVSSADKIEVGAYDY